MLSIFIVDCENWSNFVLTDEKKNDIIKLGVRLY